MKDVKTIMCNRCEGLGYLEDEYGFIFEDEEFKCPDCNGEGSISFSQLPKHIQEDLGGLYINED